MKKYITIILLIISVLFLGRYLYSNQKQLTIKKPENIIDNRVQITEITEKYLSSVLLVADKNKVTDYGTGYILSDNVVVTNKHVVWHVKDKPEEVVIRYGHKDASGNVSFEDFDVEKIILPKKDHIDVAILKIKQRNDSKKITDFGEKVKFGQSNLIKKGDILRVVGYPGDKEYATLWESKGVVDISEDHLISFSAVTSPGNSGSPIFNELGELIAVNNAGDINISFGFPINKEIKDFILKNK